MMEPYKIVFKGGSGEIVEKKSRFIANVFSVETEEEALEIIEQIKKQYWDARHNCYAYVIGADGRKQRCSDDGEPQGTAGRPMLDVLLGEDIKNILVIVTRYFGGTLLGTGGLVRAYSMAVKEGINGSEIVTKCPGTKLKITTDYNGIGKLQYIAAGMDIPILDTLYEDKVHMYVLASPENKDSLIAKVNEATSATAVIEDNGEVWYSVLEDKSIHVY
ncbi:MAG: YigZ family protein [Lachnospiraceae bacterium]|nr:YigZ family protein [Lachnospiraceae bacterium]